jgi:sugar lactone lactonase YvrE
MLNKRRITMNKHTWMRILMMVVAGGMVSGCAHAGRTGAGESGEEMTASYEKPGFFVYEDDGRLWIFVEGSDAHQDFLANGKPARHVVRPGAGPNRMTLRAVDQDTIVAYLVATEGFHTKVDSDGRVWVFVEGSDAHQDFVANGKPARHVIRPGAGPLGLTLKSVDFETLDAYIAMR